jgi:hypothetical protein
MEAWNDNSKIQRRDQLADVVETTDFMNRARAPRDEEAYCQEVRPAHKSSVLRALTLRRSTRCDKAIEMVRPSLQSIRY